MGCVYFHGLVATAIFFIVYATLKYLQEEREKQKHARWNNTPKDLVILHGYVKAKTVPSCLHCNMKMETYLKMAKINFKIDTEDMYDSNGQTPWVSLNGEHVGGSEFAIDFLNRKLKKNLNENCSEVDVCNARITRVLLEDSFMWAIGLERVVYADSDFTIYRKVIGNETPTSVLKYNRKLTKERACFVGLGQHSREEVTKLMSRYLRSVSVALGEKKYFGGEKMCQEDAGIFGVLAQALWGAPGSPYEKIMTGECKNLQNYCWRMREIIYPDWDELLKKEKKE